MPTRISIPLCEVSFLLRKKKNKLSKINNKKLKKVKLYVYITDYIYIHIYIYFKVITLSLFLFVYVYLSRYMFKAPNSLNIH